MIASESDLWERLRPAADASRVFWERFEDRGRNGIPDLYLSNRDTRGWVELKVEALRYQPGQLGWALRAAERRERAVTLLARSGRLLLFDTGQVAIAELFAKPRPPALWNGPEHDMQGAIRACLETKLAYQNSPRGPLPEASGRASECAYVVPAGAPQT